MGLDKIVFLSICFEYRRECRLGNPQSSSDYETIEAIWFVHSKLIYWFETCFKNEQIYCFSLDLYAAYFLRAFHDFNALFDTLLFSHFRAHHHLDCQSMSEWEFDCVCLLKVKPFKENLREYYVEKSSLGKKMQLIHRKTFIRKNTCDEV